MKTNGNKRILVYMVNQFMKICEQDIRYLLYIYLWSLGKKMYPELYKPMVLGGIQYIGQVFMWNQNTLSIAF